MDKGELVLDNLRPVALHRHRRHPGDGHPAGGPRFGLSVRFEGLEGPAPDGGKSYTVTLPGPVPAKAFWSFTAYDGQTRSLLETDQRTAGLDSLSKDVKANKDGSYTIHFGPKGAPRARRQLGADDAQQELLCVPPPLRPAGGVVRQELEAGRFRAGQVTCSPHSGRDAKPAAGERCCVPSMSLTEDSTMTMKCSVLRSAGIALIFGCFALLWLSPTLSAGKEGRTGAVAREATRSGVVSRPRTTGPAASRHRGDDLGHAGGQSRSHVPGDAPRDQGQRQPDALLVAPARLEEPDAHAQHRRDLSHAVLRYEGCRAGRHGDSAGRRWRHQWHDHGCLADAARGRGTSRRR